MTVRSGNSSKLVDATLSSTTLGVRLSEHSRAFQLIFCCAIIFVGFLVNGICEEYVFRQLQFSYAWYFTLVQCSVYVILAFLQGGWQRKMTAPWRTYFLLSFVWVGSVGLTKASLRYINYPAQIMFKSSKIIPVMIMGAVIPDVSVTPTFEITGILMIIGALIFDAFLGNIQEALFVSYPNVSQEEVLFCTNFLSIPLLFIPMVGTGEIWSAWQSGIEGYTDSDWVGDPNTRRSHSGYLYTLGTTSISWTSRNHKMVAASMVKYPRVYIIIGLAAIATYVGQLAILALIALFGAATAYMATSLRKVFTLCLSYLIFTKPFQSDHLLGMLLIFVSIGMKMLFKPQKTSTTIRHDVMTPTTADEEQIEFNPSASGEFNLKDRR